VCVVVGVGDDDDDDDDNNVVVVFSGGGVRGCDFQEVDGQNGPGK